MNTVIDHLSLAAKQILYFPLKGNIGLLQVNENFDRVFPKSEAFGRYVLQEYNSTGEKTKNVWLLLFSDSTGEDSGRLLGFLSKTAKELGVSFIFKPHLLDVFSTIQNPNVPEDKYEIGDRSVVLESVRSPHSIFKQRW